MQGAQNTNWPLQASTKVSTIFSGDYGAADEGNYYIVQIASGTASNAVATTSVGLANANPSVAMVNKNAVGSGVNIYLRYAKFYITTIPTTATSVNYNEVLDPNPVKVTTAGTTMAPVNINAGSGNTSSGAWQAGVIVAAAITSTGRTVGAGQVTGAIPVAFDEWYFSYGAPTNSVDLIGTQTAVKRVSVPRAPVIIPPQWYWTLGFWGASWGASTWNFGLELGYIERPSGQ